MIAERIVQGSANAETSEMENDCLAFYCTLASNGICDVPTDDLNTAAGESVGQVFHPAVGEVIEHGDAAAGSGEAISEVGADEAGTTGHQHAAVGLGYLHVVNTGWSGGRLFTNLG